MHPFVPNPGQGACQIIEDARVRAAGLATGHHGEAVNQWMKLHRRARLEYAHITANKVERVVQNSSPLMRQVLAI